MQGFVDIVKQMTRLLDAPLETPEGLAATCEKYGLAPRTGVDCKLAFGNNELGATFVSALLVGVGLGRAQVRAEAGQGADPSWMQPSDDYLESLKVTAHE